MYNALGSKINDISETDMMEELGELAGEETLAVEEIIAVVKISKEKPVKQPTAHSSPAHRSTAHSSTAYNSPAHRSPAHSSPAHSSPAKMSKKMPRKISKKMSKKPTKTFQTAIPAGKTKNQLAEPTGRESRLRLQMGRHPRPSWQGIQDSYQFPTYCQDCQVKGGECKEANCRI
jgi:hypothetical protein